MPSGSPPGRRRNMKVEAALPMGLVGVPAPAVGGGGRVGAGAPGARRHTTPPHRPPPPPPPPPRLREYILVLRAIWDSWQNKSRPSFQGEHYTYTLMSPFFDPGPIEHPHIPIYISAVGPYMCRLVGELSAGVRLHFFCTSKYLKEVVIPNIEAGAKTAGRSLKGSDIPGGG